MFLTGFSVAVAIAADENCGDDVASCLHGPSPQLVIVGQFVSRLLFCVSSARQHPLD